MIFYIIIGPKPVYLLVGLTAEPETDSIGLEVANGYFEYYAIS